MKMRRENFYPNPAKGGNLEEEASGLGDYPGLPGTVESPRRWDFQC